ncbi:hypothetical protein ACFUTX_15280 [Microbacterium sp. NPDC057407]|uniref:hypothetical protein n=1 Tax=Microbacterium sp. NPDC057407 TaxID=3346120 RepID=UPI003670ED52
MTMQHPVDRAQRRVESQSRPQLVWVGDGGWVAVDPTADVHDPLRVLAFLECRNTVVRLEWIRDAGEVREFATLREALDAIDDAILVGGVRQAPRVRPWSRVRAGGDRLRGMPPV